MDQAVEHTIKGCSACGLNQPLNKYTPLQTTPLPRDPWVKGAVDLVGRIDGKYILTYIDYYSSYPEACILQGNNFLWGYQSPYRYFLIWVPGRNCFWQQQTVHRCRIWSVWVYGAWSIMDSLRSCAWVREHSQTTTHFITCHHVHAQKCSASPPQLIVAVKTFYNVCGCCSCRFGRTWLCKLWSALLYNVCGCCSSRFGHTWFCNLWTWKWLNAGKF